MDHPSPLEPACATPAPDRAADAWRAWEGHCESGRIGARTVTPSEAACNLARWDDLFRRHRRGAW